MLQSNRDNLCYILLHQLKPVAATQYFHIFSIKFNILSIFYISTLYHHISSLETNILSNCKPFPKYSDIFQFSSYCRTLHLYDRVFKQSNNPTNYPICTNSRMPLVSLFTTFFSSRVTMIQSILIFPYHTTISRVSRSTALYCSKPLVLPNISHNTICAIHLPDSTKYYLVSHSCLTCYYILSPNSMVYREFVQLVSL